VRDEEWFDANGPTKRCPTSIIEPRVNFIKGWLTGGTDPGDGSVECGDGTLSPMVVTLDQLAEIFYRVKDAWFTQGTYSISGSDLELNAVDPPTELRSELYANPQGSRRGYSISGTLPSALDSFFGAAYTVDSVAWRDIGDSELAMWIPDSVDYEWYLPDMDIVNLAGQGPATIASAFNCHMAYSAGSDPSEAGYAFIRYENSGGEEWTEAAVAMSGVVVWTGADSPLDPAATLYLGIEMVLTSDAHDVEFGSFNRTASVLTSVNFKLKLSDGSTPSCPLYNTGAAFTSGTDFVLEAKKWWPYATTTGDPAWDTATGLPINGGPGA